LAASPIFGGQLSLGYSAQPMTSFHPVKGEDLRTGLESLLAVVLLLLAVRTLAPSGSVVAQLIQLTVRAAVAAILIGGALAMLLVVMLKR
jgi:hypothetical protein